MYSRKSSSAKSFADDYGIAHYFTDMDDAINHPDTEVVVIALPNNLHEVAVMACVRAGKNVLCTKPLGRTAAEAKRMLDAVERAGIFGGYLEDLCYTPKFLNNFAGAFVF